MLHDGINQRNGEGTMREYCCRFDCISKDCCEDDCSEIQCQFVYDCEFCRHYEKCEQEHEEKELEGDAE